MKLPTFHLSQLDLHREDGDIIWGKTLLFPESLSRREIDITMDVILWITHQPFIAQATLQDIQPDFSGVVVVLEDIPSWFQAPPQMLVVGHTIENQQIPQIMMDLRRWLADRAAIRWPELGPFLSGAMFIADTPATFQICLDVLRRIQLQEPELPDRLIYARMGAATLEWLVEDLEERTVEWALALCLDPANAAGKVTARSAALGKEEALRRCLQSGLLLSVEDGFGDWRRPLSALQTSELFHRAELRNMIRRPSLRAMLERLTGNLPIFHHPPPPPVVLIGRENAADRLRGMLEGGDTVRYSNLWGPVGIGKSALAASVCATLPDREVIWVDVAREGARWFRRLAEQAGILQTHGWEQKLSRRLSRMAAILVLDHTDELAESEILDVLPTGVGSLSILLISRLPMHFARRQAIMMSVDPLEIMASKELLAARVSPEAMATVTPVLTGCGGNPAALLLAAKQWNQNIGWPETTFGLAGFVEPLLRGLTDLQRELVELLLVVGIPFPTAYLRPGKIAIHRQKSKKKLRDLYAQIKKKRLYREISALQIRGLVIETEGYLQLDALIATALREEKPVTARQDAILKFLLVFETWLNCEEGRKLLERTSTDPFWQILNRYAEVCLLLPESVWVISVKEGFQRVAFALMQQEAATPDVIEHFCRLLPPETPPIQRRVWNGVLGIAYGKKGDYLRAITLLKDYLEIIDQLDMNAEMREVLRVRSMYEIGLIQTIPLQEDPAQQEAGFHMLQMAVSHPLPPSQWKHRFTALFYLGGALENADPHPAQDRVLLTQLSDPSMFSHISTNPHLLKLRGQAQLRLALSGETELWQAAEISFQQALEQTSEDNDPEEYQQLSILLSRARKR